VLEAFGKSRLESVRPLLSIVGGDCLCTTKSELAQFHLAGRSLLARGRVDSGCVPPDKSVVPNVHRQDFSSLKRGKRLKRVPQVYFEPGFLLAFVDADSGDQHRRCNENAECFHFYARGVVRDLVQKFGFWGARVSIAFDKGNNGVKCRNDMGASQQFAPLILCGYFISRGANRLAGSLERGLRRTLEILSKVFGFAEKRIDFHIKVVGQPVGLRRAFDLGLPLRHEREKNTPALVALPAL
jgi:hypothetical protein